MSRSDPTGSGSGEAIGLWTAVSIGVGGMVGGGIFAVLGLSVQLTGGGAPLAFAIAGAVAALTAASYARLSVRYPDRGGTTTYLNAAFGTGIVSGGLNILVWLSYIVMLSLYAGAFGNYFVTLLPGSPPGWAANVALSAAIVVMTALNAASAAAVGRAEEWIVSIKILILVVFVGAGLTVVDPDRLAVDTWAGPLAIAGGGMLIFVAYEGFELIANASEDISDPDRTLPKAFAVSVGGVTLLYVLVAVATVGVLSLDEIQQAEDFALAEAARPRFGQAGFTIIGIAAVLSTASAINATLYGATRLTYGVAESGELPAPFGRRLRGGIEEGLLITSLLTLLIANTFDLSRISTIGSVGFLIVFAAVNLAAIRLREHEGEGRPDRVARGGRGAFLPTVGLLGCAGALIALFVEAASSDPVAALFAVALPALAVGAEAGYRGVRGTGREPVRATARRPGRDEAGLSSQAGGREQNMEEPMTDDSPAEHTLPHHLEHLAMTADDIVALVTRAHQEGEIHPEVLAKSEKLAVGLREVVNELVHRDKSGLAAQPSDVWKMLTAKHRGSEDGTIT